jgi:hypothetical protein
MDNDFAIDIDAILDAIDKADVITIRFLILPHRLLIDARHSEVEGPLVKVVPRARSLEERFKAIKQLRPHFRLPDKITAIWWPKRVESLVAAGIWQRVVQRVSDAGFPDAAQQCQQVLDDLICQERAEIGNAVTGTGYQSLWQREC